MPRVALAQSVRPLALRLLRAERPLLEGRERGAGMQVVSR
jgi:hypothetical protein